MTVLWCWLCPISLSVLFSINSRKRQCTPVIYCTASGLSLGTGVNVYLKDSKEKVPPCFKEMFKKFKKKVYAWVAFFNGPKYIFQHVFSLLLHITNKHNFNKISILKCIHRFLVAYLIWQLLALLPEKVFLQTLNMSVSFNTILSPQHDTVNYIYALFWTADC